MTDTELLDYLESLFAGKFRNSIIIAHDIFDFEKHARPVMLDIRSQNGPVHRRRTLRKAIESAIKYEQDNKPNDEMRDAKGETKL